MAVEKFEIGKMYISTANGLIIEALSENAVKVKYAGTCHYQVDDILANTGWAYYKFNEYVVPDVPAGMSKPIPALPDGVHCETITFTFSQDANCVDGGDMEELVIEAKSSLGITGDEGAFYVLKTSQWAVDGDELQQIIDRCKEAVDKMVRKDK